MNTTQTKTSSRTRPTIWVDDYVPAGQYRATSLRPGMIVFDQNRDDDLTYSEIGSVTITRDWVEVSQDNRDYIQGYPEEWMVDTYRRVRRPA